MSMKFTVDETLTIAIEPAAPEPLRRAAADLIRDLHAVTGITFGMAAAPATENAVDIRICPELFSPGAWENYHVYADSGNVLRIDGSDLRGAIYGIYEFSRRYLGIQPDYLWNLLPVRKLTSAEWSGIDFSAGNPQLRYRGIFINDEDLLTAWETGEKREIDYPFYHTVISRAVAEKVAETVIRMGYNLAIPASFLDIRNPAEEMLAEVFSRRGLILSMHHVEPLGVSAFGFENYWKKRGQKRDYSYFRDPATYGMLSTRLIMDSYDMDFDHYNEAGELEPMINLSKNTDPAEKLDQYYNGRNNFLPYVGYMVTSLARYELMEFAKTIGYDKCLYMDTDSIFYFKDDETEDKIKELNALHHKTASYVTDNYGERIYYDVFEPEKDIVAFKGLHSKCYGYITEDDELIATIAGVPARTLIGQRGDDLIYLTREEELAGITAEMKLADPDIQIKDKIAALDNLKIGAKFKTNTGTTSTYIIDKPHIEIINGHKTQLAGGCVINKLAEKKIKDFTIDEIDEIEDYPDEQSEN